MRVPEHELKELGGAQRGVDGVLGGDGQAERAGDALGLRALPVGSDHLQVPGVLCTDTLLSLWDTSARPGPQSWGAVLRCCPLLSLPPPAPHTPSFWNTTTPSSTRGLGGAGWRLAPANRMGHAWLSSWGSAGTPGLSLPHSWGIYPWEAGPAPQALKQLQPTAHYCQPSPQLPGWHQVQRGIKSRDSQQKRKERPGK